MAMGSQRTIHKYTFVPGNPHMILQLSPDAKLVHADVQYGNYCVWIEHHPDHGGPEEFTFLIVGTGHPIPPGFKHQCSFSDKESEGEGLVYIWHVYKLEKEPPKMVLC